MSRGGGFRPPPALLGLRKKDLNKRVRNGEFDTVEPFDKPLCTDATAERKKPLIDAIDRFSSKSEIKKSAIQPKEAERGSHDVLEHHLRKPASLES